MRGIFVGGHALRLVALPSRHEKLNAGRGLELSLNTASDLMDSDLAQRITDFTNRDYAQCCNLAANGRTQKP
jgi:hypothetical protein